jgi:hypothetical protein
VLCYHMSIMSAKSIGDLEEIGQKRINAGLIDSWCIIVLICSTRGECRKKKGILKDKKIISCPQGLNNSLFNTILVLSLSGGNGVFKRMEDIKKQGRRINSRWILYNFL